MVSDNLAFPRWWPSNRGSTAFQNGFEIFVGTLETLLRRVKTAFNKIVVETGLKNKSHDGYRIYSNKHRPRISAAHGVEKLISAALE